MRRWHPGRVLAWVALLTVAVRAGSDSISSSNEQQPHDRRILAAEVFTPGEVMAMYMPGSPDLTQQEPAGAYAALCLVARDSQEEVREWVLYHRWLGFGKVYLYDHGSEPPLYEFVADLVAEGFVEYQYFTGHHEAGGLFIQTAHGYAYNDCLLRNRMKHRWMAFFEVDEYLVIYDRTIPNLMALLKDYEGYGGLAINWLTFAGSGKQEHPVGGLLATYNRCPAAFSQLNRRVKVVVNPRYTLGFYDSVHVPAFTMKNLTVVVEGFQEVPAGVTAEAKYSKVALHRYPCRTQHACDAVLSAIPAAESSSGGPEGNGRCVRGLQAASKFLEATGANLHWRRFPRAKPAATLPRMVVFPKAQ